MVERGKNTFAMRLGVMLAVTAVTASLGQEGSSPDAATTVARSTEQFQSVLRSEIQVPGDMALSQVLAEAGVASNQGIAVAKVLGHLGSFEQVPRGTIVRLLFAQSPEGRKVLWRVSLYVPQGGSGTVHVATVAANDLGQYVIGIQPDWPETDSRPASLPVIQGDGMAGKQARY